MAELSVVGKSVPRVDAKDKATGGARFRTDFWMPGMIYAKLLRSPYAHAKIVRIDTAKAEAVPEVKAVLTAKDVPEERVEGLINDQYVLPRDYMVGYIGQPVAAVAAETIEISEDALRLIDIDYEELPAVFDPEEAISNNAPTIIHPDFPQYLSADNHFKRRIEPEMPNVCKHFKIRKGDTEKGLQEADIIVENRFSIPRIQHCQLETMGVYAWVEADGTLVLRSYSQMSAGGVRHLARLLHIPASKIRVVYPYSGGSFGGKTSASTALEPIALLLAIKSGRPVGIVLTRDEHFIDYGHRGAMITYIKDGVKKDGTLVAREVRIILDCGLFAGMAAVIVRSCSFAAVGTYRAANFKLDSYGVYTNLPKAVPYRGFGSPEVNWAIEQQMDIIAHKLGIDAVEVRRKNILREGEEDVCGQITRAIGVAECLHKVADWIQWDKNPNQEHPWKRGKGIAVGNKTTNAFLSVATVKVLPSGMIEVYHGVEEVGQGINTVVAQIAAEEFGVSVDRIRVVYGDTAYCPSDRGAIGSRATFNAGNAVRKACQDAKRQIFDMASVKLEADPAELWIRGSRIYVTGWPGKYIEINNLFNSIGLPANGAEVIGTGSYLSSVIPEDPETGQSEKIVPYYSYGAHAVEVAVNVETGKVKILKIGAAFDMGTPINPKMAEAQIEGGFGQGLGSTLYEQIVTDRGRVANPNFRDYKFPTALDLPEGENAEAMLQYIPHQEGPFGAKGLGEAVLVSVAPAIANAVYNATGIRIRDLPITPEKVLKALKEKGEGEDG